eukprot:s6586_g1.t1
MEADVLWDLHRAGGLHLDRGSRSGSGVANAGQSTDQRLDQPLELVPPLALDWWSWSYRPGATLCIGKTPPRLQGEVSGSASVRMR